MNYRNANSVLPKELVEMIQKYVQGECIYIPVKDKYATEFVTDYKTELEKRDALIYKNYLEGISNKRLAEIYNLSDSSIRRVIIKQRKRYRIMNEKIKKILFNWDLENSEIKQIYDTTWQVGDGYVLKVYQNQSMLKSNLEVLSILDEMNIPVGKIISTYDNQQYISDDGEFFFLTKKLSGNNIVKIGNDLKIASMMGEIIAELHMAFKKCEGVEEFLNNSLLDEMNGWVKENFENNSWDYISKEEYEEIVSQLAKVYDKLPVQLIHRDVHFGNFLFKAGEFSGYIDFDLSQKNIRIFDICYFLLGLLSEPEKLEISKENWFIFVEKVVAGYEKKLELSKIEKKAIPYVMECIELLFVSYFKSIDDVCRAKNAYKIFEYIREMENKILKSIN